MITRRLIAAVAFSVLIAATALAQSAATSDEFGRVSGGQIDAITKHSRTFSGSFGLSQSSSDSPFAGGRLFNATLGGTLVQDRVWFFAAAERSTPMSGSYGGSPNLADAKLTANIGDRQALAASFAGFGGSTAALPSSFLTLHYTGIVNDHSFFTMSATESRRAVTLLP